MCYQLDEDRGYLFFFKCKSVTQVCRSLNPEDVRVTLVNQITAFYVVETILALKNEIKLKGVILMCWWSSVRNEVNKRGKEKIFR